MTSSETDFKSHKSSYFFVEAISVSSNNKFLYRSNKTLFASYWPTAISYNWNENWSTFVLKVGTDRGSLSTISGVGDKIYLIFKILNWASTYFVFCTMKGRQWCWWHRDVIVDLKLMTILRYWWHLLVASCWCLLRWCKYADVIADVSYQNRQNLSSKYNSCQCWNSSSTHSVSNIRHQHWFFSCKRLQRCWWRMLEIIILW